MIWVQGVDVEFTADVLGLIGAQYIEGESPESGEMPRFVSDAALIFEEADVPDVMVPIFDAPMLADGVTDGFGIQGCRFRRSRTVIPIVKPDTVPI